MTPVVLREDPVPGIPGHTEFEIRSPDLRVYEASDSVSRHVIKEALLLRQLAIALAKGLLGHASLVVRVTRTYSQVLVYTL